MGDKDLRGEAYLRPFYSLLEVRLISSSKYSMRSPADLYGFGTRNGKVQEILVKIRHSFRPGREAGCIRGQVQNKSEKNWAEPPAGREARM